VAQATQAPVAPTVDRCELRKTIIMAAALSLVTLGLFMPATRCGFLGCDDPVYVTDNPVVLAGVTWGGLYWALGTAHAGLWHPLTWWSHLGDVQLFGLRPWGHHLTSVLFHAVNAGLCFLTFRSMTGAWWRSLLLAALWAWHPLRVESVAWIAERKDVLSGFFFLAALWSYAGYAKTLKWRRLGLTLILFALGLMSKAMIVTLPFVLLLLDVWPLRRAMLPWVQTQGWRRLLLEKIPFFVVAFFSAEVAVWAAKQSDALVPMSAVPLVARLSNALVSYMQYIGKWIWPVDLAVYYPFPDAPEFALAGCALVLILGFTAVTLRLASTQACLSTGWFWFLGTLVPVIGFAQAGAQAMADRFTYLPSLGLGIMGIWGIHDWASRHKWPHVALPVVAAGVALFYGTVTVTQLQYWTDSITLFKRASEVTRDNFFTESSLGQAFLQEKRFPEAIKHLQRALELDPKSFMASANLGTVYFELGRFDDALKYYQVAERLQPDQPGINWMLGRTFMAQQKLDLAEDSLRRSLRSAPDQAQARMDLAQVLASKGRGSEAKAELIRLIEAKPAAIQPRLQLSLLLEASGQGADAVQQYREILRVRPDSPIVLNNLGWILATHADASVRNGAEAVRYAERACALVGEREAMFLGTLAAAYAEAGRFEEAARTATRAIATAEQNGQAEVVAANQRLLELYKASKPYRSVATNSPAP
jgi:tetratricopeptide (TPR) repeat protein